MRILYIHQYFNTPEMSGSTRSFEMGRRLVEMGHEVTVMTSDRSGTAKTRWTQSAEAGMKVFWLNNYYSQHLSSSKRIQSFLRFSLLIAIKAQSVKADLVFASSTPLTVAIPAAIAASRLRAPMVLEVRDLWPEMPVAMGELRNPIMRWAAEFLESWAYRRSQGIIALSPGMRDGVASAGYPRNKIAVIPNACDNKFFSASAESSANFRSARPWLGKKPLIVYAGSFGRVNDLEYAVDLALVLKNVNSDIRLLLVGEGSQLHRIKSAAKKTGVLGFNLFLEAQIPKHKTPELFAAADMVASFVIDIPEAQKNSANKFFDALSAGKPVLLNHGGWMHDLVRKHQCGLAAWGQSIDAIARELDAILLNKAVMDQMAANAKNLAEQIFDRDALALKLEQALSSVASGKPEVLGGLSSEDFS